MTSLEEGKILHVLCKKGNIKKVREYIKETAKESLAKELTTRSDSSGYTPLHEAVVGGNPLVVNLILEKAEEFKVDVVDTKSHTGWTALHIAAHLDSAGCAEVLLQNNADMKVKNSDGKSPFETAVLGKGNVLQVFYNQELLHAVRNDSSKVGELLKKINTDKHGEETLNRSLMVATENDNAVNIGILVLKGAKDIQTCLNAAVRKGKIKARTMLMMLVAVAANDVNFVRKLFGENVEVEKGYKPYFSDNAFKQVQDIIRSGMMSTVFPLALASRFEGLVEVRDAILLRTDVDKKEGNVGWNWLRLRQLEESWLKKIGWVKTLNLAGNELEILPSTFGSYVRNVVSLNLEHNELVAIPVSVLQMDSLKELKLCHNNLTFIPTVSEWLSLTDLDLSYNQLTSLPSNVYAPRLLSLNLAQNNLTAFPPCISSFRSLTMLDLSSNYEITSIPEEIERLECLTSLRVDDIDNLQLPSQMSDANARYANLKEFYTMKVAVVGDAKAGKCALVSTLVGTSFHHRKAVVEVSEWQYESESNDNTFHFNIWNFKGQRAPHTPYKCLFSDNTLYVVAFDLSMGEKGLEIAKEWLDEIITSSLNASSIILVGTHLDEIPFRKRPAVHALMKKASDTFIKTYQQAKTVQVISVVTVGLKNNVENVRYLKDEIYRLAVLCKNKEGQALMGRGIPSSYHVLAQCVKKLQQEALHKMRAPVMTTNELRSFLEMKSLDYLFNYEKNLIDASSFLDSIGLLTHYNDHRHNLHQLYFLDPHWLCSFLSSILNKSLPINKSGIVRFSDIPKTCHSKLQEQFFAQSLVILSRHHLVMPINSNFVLLPSKLSQKRPSVLKKQFSEGPTYQYRTIPFVMNTIVPEGFWNQLLRWIIKSVERLARIVLEQDVSMTNHSGDSSMLPLASQQISDAASFCTPDGKECAVWRHGVHYLDHEVMFRLEALEFARPDRLEQGEGVLILASSNSLGNKFAKTLVQIVVYTIKAWFPTLDDGRLITARQRVQCYECMKQNKQSPFEFSVEHVLPELSKNNVYITCGHYPRADDNHSVKISDVLVQMFVSNL